MDMINKAYTNTSHNIFETPFVVEFTWNSLYARNIFHKFQIIIHITYLYQNQELFHTWNSTTF